MGALKMKHLLNYSNIVFPITQIGIQEQVAKSYISIFKRIIHLNALYNLFLVVIHSLNAHSLTYPMFTHSLT